MDLGLPVEGGEPVDHLPAHEGAAGVLEVSPVPQLRIGESGELAPGIVDVEWSMNGPNRVSSAGRRQVRSSTMTGMTREVLASYSAKMG